jgi:uncharacterized protein YqeY
MSLHQQIKTDMVLAMKAKDADRVRVLRSLMTACTNELVATKHKPDEELGDTGALAVIQREAKKRKDSIEQFTKGGRLELAEGEKAELTIIEDYLPEMMRRSEVEEIVRAKQSELGITDSSKKGMLMGAVMKELSGKADGGLVKEIVDGLLK